MVVRQMGQARRVKTAVAGLGTIFALLIGEPTAAQQPQPQFFMMRPEPSCETWSRWRSAEEGEEAARERQLVSIYTSWILGVLTGYNIALTDNGDENVTRYVELEDLLHWIDDFCLDNPTERLSIATDTMIRLLRRRYHPVPPPVDRPFRYRCRTADCPER